MLKATLRLTGNKALDVLADAGALWRLAVASLDRLLVGPFRGERLRLHLVILQTVRAGHDSLPLVALISLLAGIIVALQSAYQLEQTGSMGLVPNLVGVSVTREFAPLLTAIIVTGRFGSAVAAELGTMKISQEIDALTVMGIDPISFLVVPRLLASLISLPSLVVFSDLMGVLGGLLVSVGALGFGARGYLFDTLGALQLQDIMTGLAKGFAFAVIIGLICCQRGLQTEGGAEEVGRATTASVVRSFVLIIAADLFVTALFYARG